MACTTRGRGGNPRPKYVQTPAPRLASGGPAPCRVPKVQAEPGMAAVRSWGAHVCQFYVTSLSPPRNSWRPTLRRTGVCFAAVQTPSGSGARGAEKARPWPALGPTAQRGVGLGLPLLL